ncbi:hypothetical protein D3C71_2188380 [compost metagenome]
MADALRKGRILVPNLKGEAASGAKLTDEDARLIRLDKRLFREIAADYSVTRQTISAIKKFKTFSEVV